MMNNVTTLSEKDLSPKVADAILNIYESRDIYLRYEYSETNSTNQVIQNEIQVIQEESDTKAMKIFGDYKSGPKI